MAKELYDIGEAPPIGEVPPKMHGWLIRPERFGEPSKAFKEEVIDTSFLASMDRVFSALQRLMQ